MALATLLAEGVAGPQPQIASAEHVQDSIINRNPGPAEGPQVNDVLTKKLFYAGRERWIRYACLGPWPAQTTKHVEVMTLSYSTERATSA